MDFVFEDQRSQTVTSICCLRESNTLMDLTTPFFAGYFHHLSFLAHGFKQDITLINDQYGSIWINTTSRWVLFESGGIPRYPKHCKGHRNMFIQGWGDLSMSTHEPKNMLVTEKKVRTLGDNSNNSPEK